MRRIASLLVVVGTLMALQAGTALARGGGWEPLPSDPFDADLCGTTIHFEFPVNKEYVKFVPLPGGVTLVKITGSFTALMTDLNTGTSLEENVSGPARSLSNPDGSYEFIAQGLTLFLGLPDRPEILISRGLVDVLYLADGSVQVKRMNQNIIDVCALLT